MNRVHLCTECILAFKQGKKTTIKVFLDVLVLLIHKLAWWSDNGPFENRLISLKPVKVLTIIKNYILYTLFSHLILDRMHVPARTFFQAKKTIENLKSSNFTILSLFYTEDIKVIYDVIRMNILCKSTKHIIYASILINLCFYIN